MRARVACVGAIAVGAMALSACTGSPAKGPSGEGGSSASSGGLSGTITFQTWSLKNDKFTPYFEKLVSDFEAENPGTTVNWVDQPGDGYEDKILQQAEAGELPDVINLPDTFAYQLAKADRLENLQVTDTETLKTYVSGGVDGYTFDGLDGTWAYPWYLGTDLSWWNKTQLSEAGIAEPPATMDQYLADAKTAAEATNGKVRLVSSMPDLTTLTDAGVTAFSNGAFVFNTPEAEKILQTYVDLFAAGAIPPDALNNDYAGNSTLFTQGKVGFTTSTGSFVTQLTNDAPNLLTDVSVTKRLVTPPLFLQGVSISKDSQNKALAQAFARYVTNDENQIAFVQLAQGFLPSTVSANENPDALTPSDATPLLTEAVKLASEEMTEAKSTTVIQYTDDMKKYTAQQFALALQGDLSVKDALDKAVDYANQNLAQ